MGSFADQMEAFKTKAMAKVDQVVQDVTISVATSLVEKSPVEFGDLKASWRFTEAAPSTEQMPRNRAKLEGDLTGSETIETITGQARATPAGGVNFVVSNSQYVEVVEYGMYPNPPKHPTGRSEGGFSTQAPAGMRDVTLLEFDSMVQAAISKS